jgi:hypothetical protein
MDPDAQKQAKAAEAVLNLFKFHPGSTRVGPNKLKKSATLEELYEKWLELVSLAVLEPLPQEPGQAGSILPSLKLKVQEGDDSVKQALCQGAAVLLRSGDSGKVLQVTAAGASSGPYRARVVITLMRPPVN